MNSEFVREMTVSELSAICGMQGPKSVTAVKALSFRRILEGHPAVFAVLVDHSHAAEKTSDILLTEAGRPKMFASIREASDFVESIFWKGAVLYYCASRTVPQLIHTADMVDLIAVTKSPDMYVSVVNSRCYITITGAEGSYWLAENFQCLDDVRSWVAQVDWPHPVTVMEPQWEPQ